MNLNLPNVSRQEQEVHSIAILHPEKACFVRSYLQLHSSLHTERYIRLQNTLSKQQRIHPLSGLICSTYQHVDVDPR